MRQTLARLKGEPAPASAPDQGAKTIPAEQQSAIRGMVDGLDARLKNGGGTPDEWVRLIRSRTVLGERDQAQAALVRARTALASDPQGLALVEAAGRELGLAQGAASADTPATPPAPAGQAPEAKAEQEAAMAAVRAMPPAERDAAVRGMVEAWTAGSRPRAAAPTSGCASSGPTPFSASAIRRCAPSTAPAWRWRPTARRWRGSTAWPAISDSFPLTPKVAPEGHPGSDP